MIKVKNYKEFQHFKDRSPPWIKLYKTVLERRDIAAISDCNFRVLVGLWLLASEDEKKEGYLPPIPDIAFRLRKSEVEIKKAIQDLKPFLIHGDIAAISEGYRDDEPETETEGETETDFTSDFEIIWKLYPAAQPKGAKNKALAKYTKLRKDIPAEKIKDGVLRYAKFCKATNQYNQHMTTWLNGKGWEEEWPTGKAEGRNDGII